MSETTTAVTSGAGAGLVVGDRVVRLVMLRTGPDGSPQANQWTESLPQGAVRDGRILDADQVRAALELLARRADPMLAAVPTWLGIHPASSVVQTVDLSGLSSADAEGRLSELAADLGEGMVGGWEIRPWAGRVRALIVAAPRVEVVKAAELAEVAGFRVAGMELLPVALVRALARDNQPAGVAVYGLGQGGGRCAVAWRSGTPVLGGRLWPPAAGDAGLSVYAVPPADLDLLARSGAGFATGALGFPVDGGLDLDPGLGMERLLATLGADLPQGPEVDAPALGLALVASGRVAAPVDLLAASGSAPPPPGAILIDLRHQKPAAGVIDLTSAPSPVGPEGDGGGSAVLAAAGVGAAGAAAIGLGRRAMGVGARDGAAAVTPVDPLIDAAIGRSPDQPWARRTAAPIADEAQVGHAAVGKAGSSQRRASRRPIGWVGLFGAGAGTLLFGGLAAFAVSRSGGEESAPEGPDPVTRSTGRTVGTAALPSELTGATAAVPNPRPTTGATTTSAAEVTDPAVSTPPGAGPSVEPTTSTEGSLPGATTSPVAPTVTTTPAPGRVTVSPPATGTAVIPRPADPAPRLGAPLSAAEQWAGTIAIPVDRSVTSAQTAVLAEGRLTVAGAVASVPEAQQVLAKAAEFVGSEQVVVELVVNPEVPVAAQAPAIVVEDNVLFAFGSADLLPEYTAVLDLEARVLVAQPSASITVGAHTDSIGSEEYNQALSAERANAVRTYLVDKGVAPTQIVVTASGESDPVADNGTAEGRQLNRRVCTELQGVLDS